MELPLVKEYAHIAREKWVEYAKAVKKNPGDKMYKSLRNLYQQIYRGKKIVEISEVIKAGGLHNNSFAPMMAIAPADARDIYCIYRSSGDIMFSTYMNDYQGDIQCRGVSINKCFRPLSSLELKDHPFGFRYKAPVPIMPPNVKPPKVLKTHYILWEVDSWSNVAPVDPWLLERIEGTRNFFVVLNGWELSPLEQAVMNVNIR